MKFDKTKLLTTVSAVALMLAVGACSSSGDDDGINAERDDALTAQKAALAAQATAEAARDAALTAQMAAETERDDALAAQTTAEKDAATAEQARMDAVAAQMTAEMNEADAELARMAAVTAKEMAEMAEATAEQARMDAVAAQMTAEMNEADAELARMAAVTAKEMAEMAEATAEQARMDAVAAQMTAEMNEADAELARMAAVTAKEMAEMAEATAEQARMDAVAAQMTAEMNEADTELARMAAVTAKEMAEMGEATAEQARMDAVDAQTAAEMNNADTELARMAAVTAKEMAEMAEATAEQARMDAVAAQMTAEMNEADTELARMAAVTAKEMAEMGEATAEQARMDAVDAQTAAEMNNADTELARMAAVTAKEMAEMAEATAELARMDAVDAKTAAETAQGEAVLAKTAAEAARDQAVIAQGTAEMARDDALEAQRVAEAAKTTADGDLVTANAKLATAKADLIQAKLDLAEANKRADDAEKELDEIKKTTADNEASGRAKGLLTALVVQAAATDPDLTATAKRTADGVSVLFQPAGTPAKSDYAATDVAVAGIAGWDGSMLAKKAGDDSTESVILYTNVEGLGPKSLLADEQAGDTDKFFVVTDGMDAEAAFVKSASTESIPVAPQTGSTEVLFGELVTPVGGGNQLLQFTGTWRGVPGTFTCVGTCDADDKLSVSATRNVKGEEVLTANFDDKMWNFQPTDSKATVMVPDEDYLYFGWWQDRPTKADAKGAFTYMFQTFAGGSQAFTAESRAMEMVVGDATYDGAAAGRYAQEGGTRLKPTYESGMFTATATLKAKFGGDPTDEGTDTDAGTIEGTITDFMEGGDPLVGWKVMLNPIALTDSVATFSTLPALPDTPEENDDNAVAEIDGVKSTTGEWSGQFFGNGRNDGQPGSVAGQFEAQFGAGQQVHTTIAGAYGAQNSNPDSE